MKRVLKGDENLGKKSETLLVLIPKVENPSMIGQFMSITLCNVVYKLIMKAMVNILKGIMKEIVAPNPGSFVPWRQITDIIIF